jgi:hypothetical protein
MASTPEGRVKDQVKKALAIYHVYPFTEVAAKKHARVDGVYYMPVAGPFAVHGVHDFVGCWGGKFFSLETKAPNEPVDETIHQGKFRVAVTAAGGIALTGVRDGAVAVDRLYSLIVKGETK